MSRFIPPDWRDASAFPKKADDWALDKWAWEFLRRNPDYQKDYEHFASLPSYRANGTKTVKWFRAQAMWWDDPELRYCKQPIIDDDESLAHYFHRTGDDTPFYYSLEDHLIEKWGITCEKIFEPSFDDGDQCLCSFPELPKLLEINDPELHLEFNQTIAPDGMFDVTLRFDLRYSIEKQLNEAKDTLLHFRDGLKNHTLLPELKHEIVKDFKSIQIKKLPIYLRVYDGYHAGATFSEIGKVVFNGTDENVDKQRAYRAYNNAFKMVYGGYLELTKQI